MLMRSTLSRLPKEKDHRVRVMGVLSAVVHIFNETVMHARAQASNRMAKANRASHDPRVSPHSQTKAIIRNTLENTKENSKEPKVRNKVPRAYTRTKHRERISQIFKLEIRDKLGNLGLCTDAYH